MRGRRRGMTLIEMMGVAVLIAVLAGMATIGYRMVINRTKDQTLDDRFRAVATAIQFYEIDNGVYPSNLNDLLKVSISGRPYLPEVPRDPYLETGGGTAQSQSLDWNASKRLLRSAGPDARRFTSDDICFHVQQLTRVACQ